MKVNFDNLPKNLIKAELKRRGLKVKNLVDLLRPLEEDLTESSFNNKISRGTFSAVFFLKCMKALEVKDLKIGEY